MADLITERTAQLEQGLDDLQTQMNARVDAPPQPLTQPAAPQTIDPTANMAQPLITNVTAAAPQQEAPPSPDDHPTWDEIESTPEYKDANPTEKALTYARWHDATYNMLQDHPDWPVVKDEFNKNAAIKEQELSKAAGFDTADQVRAQVGKDAIAAAGATTPQAERDALKPLGPDVARAYLNDKLGVKEYVAPDDKLVNAEMANNPTMTREEVERKISNDLETQKPTTYQDFGARVLLKPSKMLNGAMASGIAAVKPFLNESGQRMADDSYNYFKDAADVSEAAYHQEKGGIIDPDKSDTVPAIVADTLGTILATAPATAATFLIPEATIPAGAAKLAKIMGLGLRATGLFAKYGKIAVDMIPVGAEFAGSAANDAYDAYLTEHPKDEAGATKAATIAAAKSLEALPAYALGLGATSSLEMKALPRIMNPLLRGGARFITGTAGNILATEALKLADGKPLGLTKEDIVSSATFAAHPALEAGKAEYHAAVQVPIAQSIMKGTDEKLQIFDKLAADETAPQQIRDGAARSAAAMRKDAADFLKLRKIEPEQADPTVAVAEKAADNADAANAHEVADVTRQIARAKDPDVKKAVDAANKVTAQQKMKEAPTEGGDITFEHVVDLKGGKMEPKANIPEDATIDDLMTAKKELDSVYKPGSHFHTELNRQLDEAIAERDSAYDVTQEAPAPTSAPEHEVYHDLEFGPSHIEEKQVPRETRVIGGVTYTKGDDGIMTRGAKGPRTETTDNRPSEREQIAIRSLISGLKQGKDVRAVFSAYANNIRGSVDNPEHPLARDLAMLPAGFLKEGTPEQALKIVEDKLKANDVKIVEKVHYPQSPEAREAGFHQAVKDHSDWLDSQADRMGDLMDKYNAGDLTKEEHLAGIAEILAEPNPAGGTEGSLHPSKLRAIQRATGVGEKRVEGKEVQPELPEAVESPAAYSPEENKLGKYPLPKNRTISVKDFMVKGSAGGKLTKAEVDLYRMLVPDAFDPGHVMASPSRSGRAKLYPSGEVSYSHEMVNIPKLIQGLKDHGPVVEVHSIGDNYKQGGGPMHPEENVQVRHIRTHIAEMTHEWRDKLHPDVMADLNDYMTASEEQGQDSEQAKAMLTRASNTFRESQPDGSPADYGEVQEFEQKAIEFAGLYEDLDNVYGDGTEPTRDQVQDYKFVSPKNEKDLPGYKVGLIRLPVPKGKLGDQEFPIMDEKGKEVKFKGPHFGKEDLNTVAFYRGYEETMPNGEKAFHVIEVQSDWAQKAAGWLKALKTGKAKFRSDTETYSTHGMIMFDLDNHTITSHDLMNAGWKDKGLTGAELNKNVTDFVNSHAEEMAKQVGGSAPPHPLLGAYESLALKAAIQHAKEIGAKHVVISDAETAMMTEGHDRGGEVEIRIAPTAKNIARARELLKDRGYSDVSSPEDNAVQSIYVTDLQKIVNGGTVVWHDYPARANAKREGLDATISHAVPQEAGMRLHYDQTLPAAMERLTGETGKTVDLGTHKMAHAEGVRDEDGNPAPAGSQVFKDPLTGKPKENVTGRAYDISKMTEPLPLVELPHDTPAPEKPTAPEAPAAAAETISPEELKDRQAQVEAHKKRIGNPEPKSAVAREAVEAIKNGNINDLSYDGKGMVGEQFTELDPNSPSFGATFEVRTGSNLHALIEKRLQVRDRFTEQPEAPEAPGTAPRELSKDENREINKTSYAEAQAEKRAAGNAKDYDVTAAYNRIRAKKLAEAQAGPAKPAPKIEEAKNRAERSAANKAAHKEMQQKASAARKAAREAAGHLKEEKDQITQDTLKNGVLPTWDEMSAMHPDMDITTATDLTRKLHEELTKAYPPEPTPEGAKVTHVEHSYTKENLPMISEKGPDGVERTRPQFTNDPEITAQQKDDGLFSNDAGSRLYIPDELIDNEQINPAIGEHMKWDPEAKQYYVGDVLTKHGMVHASHEEAVLNQSKAVSRKEGVRDAEQMLSYTQLRNEHDVFGRKNKELAQGDKLESVAADVQKKLGGQGIDIDQINWDFNKDPEYENEEGLSEFPQEPMSTSDAGYVSEREAMIAINSDKNAAELDRLGLLPHLGGPKINLNDALTTISKDPNIRPWMRDLAKLVKDSGYDLSDWIVNVVAEPNSNFAGRFHYDGFRLGKEFNGKKVMQFNLATQGHHLGGLATTFMHEMFHGIMDGKLDPDAKRNPVEERAYKVLKSLHDQVSKALFKAKYHADPTAAELAEFQDAQYGKTDHPAYVNRTHYGISNLKEFMTETFTNPAFGKLIDGLDLKLPELKAGGFGTKIIDMIKRNVMTLFAGKEITPTSPLHHALTALFDSLGEGPHTEAGRTTPHQIYEQKMRDWAIRQGDPRLADIYIARDKRKIMEEEGYPVEKEEKPVAVEKIVPKDKQGLTRAERSQINKAAYKAAQEIAKQQGKGFDVMKEYERQRDRMIAGAKLHLAAKEGPATFTAEGKAKMQELRARMAEEDAAKEKDIEEHTGLNETELNAEIAGEEEEPTQPELSGEPQKPVIHLYDKVHGNGWVTPEGKFLPIQEGYHQGLNAGVNPLSFGGHGSHGSAAWEYIQSKPELKAAFEQAAEARGYNDILEMTEGDVKDFLEARGFLRVQHNLQSTYFTGKPTLNPRGVKFLRTHAEDNGRILAHDRETGDQRNAIKELYRPPHLQGMKQRDELGFFTPPETPGAAPAEEDKDLAKVRYISRAGGKRNIEIEGIPNKAQLDAMEKQVDEDTGSSDATKSALKDQLAISAKLQEPTLVTRFQVKNPLSGKVANVKDSGKEIVVAGANSANNIPRIMAEQGGHRVAQDYGSVGKISGIGKKRKPTAEVMMDRSAHTLIVDHRKDLQTLENGRDQVANGAESGKKFLPVYDHAIANFDRLVGKEVHAKEMKAQIDREHAYGIPTPELEDYVTRILKSPDVGDNDMFAVPDGKGGVRYFTKARSFENLSDALSQGYVPKTLDIVELDAHRIEAGERLIQQKIYHESLKAVLAPDGKPIVSTTEPRQTLYKGEQQAVPKGYRLVNVPSGAPLVVHEDYVPLFKAIYGDSHRNALNKWAGFMKRNTLVLDTFHVGRIMFKEAAFSKGVGRFGYGRAQSILEYSKRDLGKALELGDISKEQHDYAMEHYENAQALIRSGLNVSKMADNMDAELVKWLAPQLNGFNTWVFGKLSRGAMLQTALANLERNQARFGELSRDQILRRTAKETNEIFGNLQLQSVFKSPQTQNLLRSLLLAPQWAESQLTQEMRGYGQMLRAPVDLLQGKARLGVVAQGQITAVLMTFMAMQVMSLAMNGHTTFQNKKKDWFALHIPQIGGRGEFEFNPLEIGSEYAFMAYRYRSQHMEPLDIAQRILFNKLNPVVHGAVNVTLNRDYQGKRYANWQDRAKAGLESAIPVPPFASSFVERDPRKLTGFRVPRQPAAWEKSLLQSAGLKVSNSQTPRGEMFALAHRFRDDKAYGDNSPPVYRDLRMALDNRNESAVRDEITMLAARGATEEQIRKAVGITHGGIAPERFTGKADREPLFLRALTPDQRKTYNEAQADHKASANLLRATLSQMKLKDTELVNQLRKNAKKPTAADFEQ